jgi:hypothetical protein
MSTTYSLWSIPITLISEELPASGLRAREIKRAYSSYWMDITTNELIPVGSSTTNSISTALFKAARANGESLGNVSITNGGAL